MSIVNNVVYTTALVLTLKHSINDMVFTPSKPKVLWIFHFYVGIINN